MGNNELDILLYHIFSGKRAAVW